MAEARKYLLFGSVLVVLVVADWVTKRWAEGALATDQRPQPIVVRADEVGRTPADLARGRFANLAEIAPADLDRLIVRLDPAEVARDAAANAYAPVATLAGPRQPIGYYVFNQRSFETAPRRIDLYEKLLVGRWLMFVMHGVPRDEVRAVLDAAYKDLTLADFVAQSLHHVSVAEARGLVEDGFVFPILAGPGRLAAARPVAAAERYLLLDRKVDVIPGLLRFDYKENPGAAFSFLGSVRSEFRFYFLCGVNLLASIAILLVVRRLKAHHRVSLVALAAVLSGAIGNVLDRIQYNYVVDFIDMYISYMHWPTYNIADIGITVGVVTLLLEMRFSKTSPFAHHEDPPAAAAA